jgi:hypothetical protein
MHKRSSMVGIVSFASVLVVLTILPFGMAAPAGELGGITLPDT